MNRLQKCSAQLPEGGGRHDRVAHMPAAAVGQHGGADGARCILVRDDVIDERGSFGVESMQKLRGRDGSDHRAGVWLQLLAVQQRSAYIIQRQIPPFVHCEQRSIPPLPVVWRLETSGEVLQQRGTCSELLHFGTVGRGVGG